MKKNLSSVSYFLRVCIFPDGVFGKLGVILAGISMMALVRNSLEIGLSDTFFIVLGWYDRFLDATIGWIGIWIESGINQLLHFLNIQISIHPHWKHIFVLLNIYFIRDAISYLESDRRRWNRFFWHLGLGLVLGAFFGTSSGIFADDGTSFYSSMAVAVTPLVAFFIYDIVERHWYVENYATETAFSRHDMSKQDAVRFYRVRTLERAALYIIFSVAFISFWYWFFDSGFAGMGVFTFILSVLIMALYWISGRASLHYRFKSHEYDHLPLLTKLLAGTGTAYLGGMMLGTFFWLLVFLLANSGLGLANL